MRQFFEISGYEFKKILLRKRTAILLTLVILISALSVFGTIIGDYYYTDDNGNEITVSRYDDEMLDRRNAEALSGRAIDADLIMEAVEAYRKIPMNTGRQYTDTKEYQQNARKYSEIYRISRQVFGLKNMEDFLALTYEQAEQFDRIRLENRDYIESSGRSEKLKAYWNDCLDKSPMVLTYEYSGGYDRFVAIMYTTGVMAAAAIIIIFSGIFSGEYASRADGLILSSKHGKGLVIGAKLFVAFAISLGIILLLVAVTYAETMIVWGSSGADADYTLMGNMFPYPLTVGQSVLLYILCMSMTCLLFAAATSCLSALLKAPYNTVVIMSIILIVPMFIAVPEGAPAWVCCLENLLPTNMLAFWGATYEYQYEIFGLVIPPYIFLPIFTAAAAAVCTYFAYRGFEKHQIG